MDYFRFLKKQQEERKLKEEKRLKAQEERKLKEQEKKRLLTKILIFAAQIKIAAFLVLIILFVIFYLYTF